MPWSPGHFPSPQARQGDPRGAHRLLDRDFLELGRLEKVRGEVLAVLRGEGRAAAEPAYVLPRVSEGLSSGVGPEWT